MHQKFLIPKKLIEIMLENTDIYFSCRRPYLGSKVNPTKENAENFWINDFDDYVLLYLEDDDISHGALIEVGYRICGENMYAKHSIKYENLESYFYGFSMWNNLECLSWKETLEWFELLGIIHVPVLYKGLFDKSKIIESCSHLDHSTSEGYVIRLLDSFHYRDFKTSVMKYVRPDHIQTINHWMRGSLEQNKMKGI